MNIKVINDRVVRVNIGDWHIYIDDSTGEKIIDEHIDAMLIKNNKRKWEIYNEK
jgi:hypothetical protein